MRNKEQQEEMLEQEPCTSTEIDNSDEMDLEDYEEIELDNFGTVTTEALELIFEVKDKYKEVMKKLVDIKPDSLGGLEEVNTVKEMVFNSIDINTSKVNWKTFRELVNRVYDKSEKKKIKKVVKKAITKEFIDTETEPRDKDFISNTGTEDFDIIKKRDGAVTVSSMLKDFGYYALVSFDDAFNVGSKTFIRLIEKNFILLKHTEKVFGIYVGTLGKINENIQYHLIKKEEHKIGRDYYNVFCEDASECKVEVLEQEKIIRVPDLLEVAASDKGFERIYKELKSNRISEMNIPVIDIEHNMFISFSINLTNDIIELMKGTEQLDIIFNKAGITSIREIYKERFLRTIVNNSIINIYLNKDNLYAEYASNKRKSTRERIMRQIEETYGNESIIYKYFNNHFFDISDEENIEFYIDILIDNLDEIIHDKIEGNTWKFSGIVSNTSEFIIKKILNAIEKNGGKVEKFNTKVIE